MRPPQPRAVRMPRPRLELDEYGAFQGIAALADEAGTSPGALAHELDQLERRIASRLSLESLERRGAAVRPVKVAGVARLAMADIEIRPKYAASSTTWREDLLELTLV